MDRTAYPRPGERLTREELDARYSLNETDHAFIRATARGDCRLALNYENEILIISDSYGST